MLSCFYRGETMKEDYLKEKTMTKTTKVAMQYKDLLEIFADKGTFVVVFDAQHKDVLIPEYLKEEKFCTLKFSHLFAPPGHSDLKLNDDGVQQTLSFNGEDFHCYVPYDSIIGIGRVDGSGIAIIDNKPKTFLQVIEGGKDE
jgi:hypothetical protein